MGRDTAREHALQRRILVVEDSRDIAELVALHLGDAGYAVDLCGDGLEALQRLSAGHYDLVVLDLMLPGMDGITLCSRLRAQAAYVPILMLTAKSTELDRVLGLEVGADDYLTKPFSLRELVARVKALFRRVDVLAQLPAPSAAAIRHDDLVINPETRSVRLGDRDLHLTAREFDLLLHFARHPGRVYTRAQLLDAVWGYGHDGYEHTVNSHINRLRAKIEDDPAHPRRLLTVWGMGYKFAEPAARG